jgi:hypothetical protein
MSKTSPMSPAFNTYLKKVEYYYNLIGGLPDDMYPTDESRIRVMLPSALSKNEDLRSIIVTSNSLWNNYILAKAPYKIFEENLNYNKPIVAKIINNYLTNCNTRSNEIDYNFCIKIPGHTSKIIDYLVNTGEIKLNKPINCGTYTQYACPGGIFKSDGKEYHCHGKNDKCITISGVDNSASNIVPNIANKTIKCNFGDAQNNSGRCV